MTATRIDETLRRMSTLEERGQHLRALVEDELGLNKSQATEVIRAAGWATFDYKTLGRAYQGDARPSTLGRLETIMRHHQRDRGVGDLGETVEVTGQSDKTIALKFRGVRVSGRSIDDVDVVVPVEFRDDIEQVVRGVVRALLAAEHDLEQPEG